MANRRYVKIGAPPSKKWWCSLLLSPQMVKLWFVFCSCRSASASSSKAWRRGRSSESSIASLSWHSRADALTRGGGGGEGEPPIRFGPIALQGNQKDFVQELVVYRCSRGQGTVADASLYLVFALSLLMLSSV